MGIAKPSTIFIHNFARGQKLTKRELLGIVFETNATNMAPNMAQTTQEDQDQVLWRKIQLIWTYLNKPDRWYTGLVLKKFLKNQIFELLGTNQNSAMRSGRWSAYCHYSSTQAFSNLLDKQNLHLNSRVLVHPLLPAPLVDVLLERGCQISSLDISKSHLNWDLAALDKYLQEAGRDFQLVINYNFSGLYEETLQVNKFLRTRSLPVLTFIDNHQINWQLLTLFEQQDWGSILWNWGDSFWDNQLDEVLDTTLPTKNWFVSWHVETRTSSILEYHLSESHPIFQAITEAYFYLLLKSYASRHKFAAIYLLGLKLFSKQSPKDINQARQIIKDNYESSLSAAVPDLVFDLKILEVPSDKKAKIRLQDETLHRQQVSRQMQQIFLQKLRERPLGSLEVPSFFLSRVYLEYFVYTTESNFWFTYMESMGFKPHLLPPLHAVFLNKSFLSQANFIARYYLGLDTLAPASSNKLTLPTA